MEQKIRYTLGKRERLKSRKEIETLFKTGKSCSVYPFRILYLLKERVANNEQYNEKKNESLQAGFTVSTRNFKKATDRNRIKRLMREAWRLQKNELQTQPVLVEQQLSVFVIFTGKELPEHEFVHEKMGLAIKRLIKLMCETSQ